MTEYNERLMPYNEAEKPSGEPISMTEIIERVYDAYFEDMRTQDALKEKQ